MPKATLDLTGQWQFKQYPGSPLTFYDFATSEPWKFTDGIDFTFPSVTPFTLDPHQYLIIAKDPAKFNALHSPLPPGVEVLGPYDGQLSNGGEKLEISMPGDVDGDGYRMYIRIDRVNYDDEAPWPTDPDGDGSALGRKVTSDYGNDVANWQAIAPSPGS